MKYFYNSLNFNLRNGFNRQLRLMSTWFYEQQVCLLCAESISRQPYIAIPLCTNCVAELPYHHQSHCPQCALLTPQSEQCGNCLQHPPAFTRTLALFRYAYPLDRLLHQYKYQQQLSFSSALSQLILNSNLHDWVSQQKIDALVSMPMHQNRLAQRGFNHVHLLAKQLNKVWKLPMITQACLRVKDTPTQAGLDLKQRVRNLNGAFATSLDWSGKHILLLDDVMTTGASLNALAQTLQKAGASRISCMVLARTLRD